MSEKIYALLFRLFPFRFRARWGQDALDLYRQRACDERGFFPRLRLWRDLLVDLAVSVPRVYLSDDPALIPAANSPRSAVPSFTMLEQKPIRSSAYLFGTLLSLTIIAGISLLSKHAGHFPMLRASAASEASGVTVDPWTTGAGSGSGSTEVIDNGPSSTPAAQFASGNPARTIVRSKPTRLVFFDAAERHRVILGIVANLNQHYPDAALAHKLGQSLRANESSGKYNSVDDPHAFASTLTVQLRTASHDLHFEVLYSQAPLREAAAPSAEEAWDYRYIMRQANCTFDKVSILPHNVGYLKLDTFPDPESCGNTAIAAMKQLSSTDALIIDLRENSGGSPAMVLFLGGWLFDRPAFFYNPRENSASNMWTHSPMAGSNLAHKPVFVLTSSRTYSAAEHFSYNLKMLRRATLIGETTAGATDIGVFHRIDEHFGIGLRESKVPNPYPTPDWAVTGVQPDISVPATAALSTAQNLAVNQLARR